MESIVISFDGLVRDELIDRGPKDTANENAAEHAYPQEIATDSAASNASQRNGANKRAWQLTSLSPRNQVVVWFGRRGVSRILDLTVANWQIAASQLGAANSHKVPKAARWHAQSVWPQCSADDRRACEKSSNAPQTHCSSTASTGSSIRQVPAMSYPKSH
jgi:hypothetical protein